ncbi:MAG: PIN domain-containing protein [Angelakisella sp.]|nr:PIN domain-containing protein [Angelakisella sp.]
MRYYAVIDTNVLVSALLNPASIPGKISAEAMEGSIIPLYNDEIIAEYNNVLRRMRSCTNS